MRTTTTHAGSSYAGRNPWQIKADEKEHEDCEDQDGERTNDNDERKEQPPRAKNTVCKPLWTDHLGPQPLSEKDESLSVQQKQQLARTEWRAKEPWPKKFNINN